MKQQCKHPDMNVVDRSGNSKRRRPALFVFLPILLAAIFAMSPAAATAAWRWQLPAARYGNLSLFERAQYDRAQRLIDAGDYRAAASEFEKFKVQFPDSPALSYVLFMRGYCLHQAFDRHTAIKVYNEVLDFFGDQIEDAAPALYFLGLAQLENGDVRDGLESMQELVDDEDYQTHPLAAGALGRLADNKWRNGKFEEAIVFWKQVVRDFSEANPVERNAAQANVTDYYIKGGNFRGYESWLIKDDERDNAEVRRNVAEYAFRRAWDNFRTSWGKYNNFNREVKAGDMKAFYEWFKTQKIWYEKMEDSWKFYSNAISFVSQLMRDTVETRRLLDESIPLHQAIQEEKARNERYAWLADRMREASDWTSGEYCISKISDPLLAGYKRYEMDAGQGEWNKAVEKLKDLEKANDPYWSPRALGERARINKDVLNNFEEAIKLYQQWNNPPHNLWAISECYRRWGKLDSAQSTLTEIENSFPDLSSRAAWLKTENYHAAGDAKQAVSSARRILKLYPASGESSRAHELLEGYGIATGGGLLDDE